MSRRERRYYTFNTAAQWSSCLFRAADRGTRAARTGLHPQAPYSFEAHRIPSPGALSPAMTPAGEILWHDPQALLRALPTDESAQRSVAAWVIAHASRMVATHDAIWVPGSAPDTLECFDLHDLTRRRVIEIAGAEVLDLAADRRDSLLVLVRRRRSGATAHELIQLDCGGKLLTLAELDDVLTPIQLALLPARGDAEARVFLLDADHCRLHGLAYGSGSASWTVQLGALRPCFEAAWLASDSRERVLLAGRDGAHFGSVPRVLVLDRDATLVDALRLIEPATGVAAGRDTLVVSHAKGIAVHARASAAGDAAGISTELITPLLTAPESADDIKWQRADAWGELPPGTSLELRYGWIDTAAARAEALRESGNRKHSPAQRLTRLKDRIGQWSAPVVMTASPAANAKAANAAPYSFPLHDARVGQLWLHLTLRAAPRASLPSLSRLVVSYASSPLLQQLPAVYRRTAVKPGDFLGALVGTFEATTQDLDRRIGSLGSLVHPDTAPVAWLDELAEWLGLPWDDALAEEQKRALLRAAAQIAAGRGTRDGLLALLGALFPGEPAPFRVTDIDVDYGFVLLGGRQCCGTALPGVLAGLPSTATVLSRKTILGSARLPCPGEVPSATARLAGILRVDLTVDPDKQRRTVPWLARLLEAAVPGNVRLDLRWHLPRSAVFGGFGELPAAPVTHLGVNAITGFARLPDTGRGNIST